MKDVTRAIADMSASARTRFEAQMRVLSMDEYLALFDAHPARHGRDASRYLRDCFDFFGTYEVERPWGSVRRFRLFDLEFEESAERLEDRSSGRRSSERLVGHESLQETVYRIVGSFAREGRANKLLLMHGPNGSAKSTFVACIMKALDRYSAHDEGALYRFSWIFPRGRDGKAIGFGHDDKDTGPGRSFAHLPESQIEAKLGSELREHPLQLLPIAERRAFVERAYKKHGVADAPPDWIWNGQLGHKNRQIFEALLTAYRGELQRVLGHVQVERYYISRRYRVGAITIGPQMAVDASERQITSDRSFQTLPASLSALTLFEPYGDLVDASGGIVEYSDLLKRPIDAWKYLLLAIETGEVSLQFSNLSVNAVLIGSSNELHLSAFREHHEYNSFRGRIQLVRVPYLLDYAAEQAIYDGQIVPQVRRHVAPHATMVAAQWAVLTRLRRAQADRYDVPALGHIAADLSPIEKADLYSEGKIPPRLSADEAKELRARMEAVYLESDTVPAYEGLSGASPREIRVLLFDAAQDPVYECLSPLAVLERIEQLCQRNDYDFLKETPDHGYHDHREFVRQVRRRWIERVEDELRTATGLVEETAYREIFERYVTHVSYWVKGERAYNRVTGKYEDPDTELMVSVERMLDAGEKPDDFRRNLMSVVAGHAIDNPGQKVDYTSLFPRHIERVREAYFAERLKQIMGIAVDVLVLLAGESAGLDAERERHAADTLARLRECFGYCEHCARDAVSQVVKAHAPG